MSTASAAIRKARQLGADPATCTALSILYWKLRKNQARIDQLIERLKTETRRPGQERLRQPLLSHLRGLRIL